MIIIQFERCTNAICQRCILTQNKKENELLKMLIVLSHCYIVANLEGTLNYKQNRDS